MKAERMTAGSVSRTLLAIGLIMTASPSLAMMGYGAQGPGTAMGWHQTYGSFSVDTSDDVFINRARFEELTGHMMAWVDEDEDGIVDYAQDNGWFHGLGIGPFVDDNGDGIHDAFETHEFYGIAGMMNFVDVDGDGLTDNYEMDPFGVHGAGNALGGHMMQQFYVGFDVDTAGDIFVNPDRFAELTGHMMVWVDEDDDGIVDFAQDSGWFHGLGIGPFVDDNGDGIHDLFETHEFYETLGMANFVDIDGDGLCDNYSIDPQPYGGTMMGGF